MLGKRAPLDAHTVLASGGINAALGTRDPEDSWEQHFADTLREGYFLGDPRMVEIMARESPDAVLELAAWGCEFARTEDGELDQRFFGAHRWRRTCFAGDFTGRAIMRTVAAKAAELRIRVEEDQYVSRLLVADGRCFGALAFDLHTGERTVHLADAVILATGGHTRIWRRSSSRRDENYGDGMRMALDAGCRLMDMELVQFHPTGMVFPEEAAGTLVTEAVRGEGGRLYNALGERYMERYDPVRLELSTRDRVALANYTEIVEGRGGPHGGVFLDITHRGKDEILEKLPRMYRQFVEWQMLDISREPMEVAPTAHYSMGGIVVDPETHATDVPGLYAAGECVGGLHGANRLGGNSLGEALISGRRAGEAAAAFGLESEVFVRSRRAIDEGLDELDALTRPGCRARPPAPAPAARPDVGALRRRPRRGRPAGGPGGARGDPRGRRRRRRPAGRRRVDGPCPRARPARRPRRRRGDAARRDRTTRDARRAQPFRLPRPRSGAPGQLLHRRPDGAVERARSARSGRASRMDGASRRGRRRATARMSPTDSTCRGCTILG